MSDKSKIIQAAVSTISKEARAIDSLKDRLNSDFIHIVEHLYGSRGRLIITGIGKSAIIASKIVATLNSTGTPSVFMHAADAIHGDLGLIREEDSVMCISKSGNTPEVKVLVPLIKSRGNLLIALVGNTGSYLARQADHVMDATVDMEACPNNLAPTSSTTAQMVLGDALAVALIHARGFSQKDFAKLHPGGTLGKKMYLRVADLYGMNEKPMVDETSKIPEVIMEISSKRLGATVVKKNDAISGIITDGDLRRMLQHHKSIEKLKAADIMSPNPKTLEAHTLAVDALDMMRKNNITQVVVTENKEYMGMVHLHDIIEAGIL
ncbi:MAG: KpsF/GutQ family sugar-phosphate isomerase [Bacteroidales bacterium]